MKTAERFLKAIKGEKVDRVPLHILGFNYKSLEEIKEIKCPKRREIAQQIFNETIYIHQVPSYINRYLVTPPEYIQERKREKNNKEEKTLWEIKTSEGNLSAITVKNKNSGNTTWHLKYPVENTDDLKKLMSAKWKIPENLKIPDEIPEDREGRRVIYSHISSPFVCVAGAMKYEYFLELCIREFNLIKEATEVCFERIMKILEVLFEKRKIEIIWMGGCEWLTPPMGSPFLYEELVHKYESKIISYIHSKGALVHVHCHGNVKSTIEKVIERKADYFEPVEPPPDGDITFEEAKKVARGRITLGGNIEIRLIEMGSEEEVEKAVEKAFEGGKERMILQTTEGPLFPSLSERAYKNYKVMINVWEKLSEF